MKERESIIACLQAWMVGIAPTEIWTTYDEFERCCNGLIAILEDWEDEAKPILEERARAQR